MHYLNVLLGNKALTAAGFVLSMGTMWGEVTHFALLDALPTAAGEPRGRTNRIYFCQEDQKITD